jgi:hypothetical protein
MTFIHSISSWVPPWLIGVTTMIVPVIVVLLIYRWFIRRLIRLAGRYSPFLRTLLSRGQGPVSVILVIVVSGIALAGANFPWDVTAAIGRALLVGFVLALGWAAAIALDIGVEIYLRRFRTDSEDNLLARKHVTQMRILQRVAKTLLAIVTVAAALMTFDSVRQYGVSLFASAGAAGLILGLAARPVLGNLLAGIQIAMTQPIRVEDQVVVEGETGWIKTIRADRCRRSSGQSYRVGRPPASQARRNRPPKPAMGRQNGEVGGDRHSHRCGGIARPGQRPHPQSGLEFALRGAGKIARISAGHPARGCRRRQ